VFLAQFVDRASQYQLNNYFTSRELFWINFNDNTYIL